MYNSKEIYQTLKPDLEALEQLRTKILTKKQQILTTCVILGCISVLAGFFLMVQMSAFAGLFAIIIGLGISFIYYNYVVGGELRRFRYLFKKQVVGGIARAIEPSLVYSPDGGVSESKFKSIGHYSDRIDRYRTEDFFQGKLGSTWLSFAEIHAEYKTESSNAERYSSTTWHTLFKGVLFEADFHKNFNTWVTIKPDNETGFFGWIGTKIQKLNTSLVRMEDPVFEQYFKVNAGDDQQARYIVTPNMQERLLAIRANYGTGIIVSFQNGSVYLTLPKKADWFEGSLKHNLLSEDHVSRIAYQISYFLQLVEDLNLNTRIWTKE